MNLFGNVAIIGSGNLATNLSLELTKKAVNINLVYSKTIDNAGYLAKKINAKVLENLSDLEDNLDLIILSITDNAYDEVLNKLSVTSVPIVHTAGSIPLDIFKDKFQHYGVFYPFQTFSKQRILNFEHIPVCIEANSTLLLEQLDDLGKLISKRVYKLTSEQRQKLHLCGIISNNFSNFLYTLAGDYLEKEGMDFEILLPLIKETIEKLEDLPPKKAQSGPAVRGNKNVIAKHKELLKNEPRLLNLYSLLSENILEYYGKT